MTVKLILTKTCNGCGSEEVFDLQQKRDWDSSDFIEDRVTEYTNCDGWATVGHNIHICKTCVRKVVKNEQPASVVRVPDEV